MMEKLSLTGLLIFILNLCAVPTMAQQGEIVIFTEHIDDQILPDTTDPFIAGIDMNFNGFDDISTVTVDIDHGDGSSDNLVLMQDDANYWSIEENLADVTSLTTLLHGTWTVTIDASVGASSANSTSTFMVDTSTIQETDYLAPPTNLSPANGDVGVLQDANISWTAPTGGSSADVLVADVYSGETGSQEAMTLNNSLLITDESWSPPENLSAGFNELSIFYINFFDETKISTIDVTNGTINWLNTLQEEFGVSLWPDNKPLFTLEADTIVGFTVVPEPGTSALLIGLSVLSLTTRRQAA